MELYVLIILAMMISLLMGLTIVCFFIRYRSGIFKQQQQAQQAALLHQQELLRATIESEEKERKRIGRDLHDDVGAALSQIRLYIERHFQDNSFGNHTKTQIDRVINDVRNISHYLSPESIHIFGFSAAVEELVEVIRESSGMQIYLMDDMPDCLDQVQSLALYRVLKELLTNTTKHAGASAIRIALRVKGKALLIDYCDNGCGLSGAPTRGIGLKNIESRLSLIGAISQIDGTGGFSMQITLLLKTFPHEPSNN